MAKRALVTFITRVINSATGVKSKSGQIQSVVKAGVNNLGLVGLAWKDVKENLTNKSSQKKGDDQ